MATLSFNNLGKFGRLGNQMFQISATIGIALDNNMEYTFNDWSYNKYLNTVLPSFDNSKSRSYVEKTFHYSPIKLSPERNWDLKGWFQTEKYFDKYSDIIKQTFELKEKYVEYILDKYNFLKEGNTCSVHVRRGDFLKLLQYHVVLDSLYYEKCMKYIRDYISDDMKFIVISDDITWCKEKFKDFDNIIFIDGEEDIIDLYVQTFCDHNIMSCSSFSWWGSWLNSNPNKVVVAPNGWFGETYSDKDISDLIPNEWVKMDIS